jgi:hypothetical protein
MEEQRGEQEPDDPNAGCSVSDWIIATPRHRLRVWNTTPTASRTASVAVESVAILAGYGTANAHRITPRN